MLDEDEDGIDDIPQENIEVNVTNKVTGQIDFTTYSNEEGRYSVQVVPMVEYSITIEDIADKKIIFQGDMTPEDNLPNETWDRPYG